MENMEEMRNHFKTSIWDIVSGKDDLFSWNLEEINSAKHCNHSYLNFFTGEKEVFMNVIENLLQTYK